MHTSMCPGCGVVLPITDYPASNPYGVTSAECRQKFDEVLVKEHILFGYPAVHRLIIDSYAVQHPRHRALQLQRHVSERLRNASVQSIAIHLIALYCALELKIPLARIASIMNVILKTMNRRGTVFPELEPPHSFGEIRCIDLYNKIFEKESLTLPEYEHLAYAWAHATWNAWKKHHAIVGQWYKKYSQHHGVE